MEFSTLSLNKLFRPGSSLNGCTVVERYSYDFVVNGQSLLNILVTAHGGHSDFMGCFVDGFIDQNAKSLERLLWKSAPDTENGRVLLYICPECGDIGCGAYAVRISRTAHGYEWKEFAYENGHEEPRIIEGIGPFLFEVESYQAAIKGGEPW